MQILLNALQQGLRIRIFHSKKRTSIISSKKQCLLQGIKNETVGKVDNYMLIFHRRLAKIIFEF